MTSCYAFLDVENHLVQTVQDLDEKKFRIQLLTTPKSPTRQHVVFSDENHLLPPPTLHVAPILLTDLNELPEKVKQSCNNPSVGRITILGSLQIYKMAVNNHLIDYLYLTHYPEIVPNTETFPPLTLFKKLNEYRCGRLMRSVWFRV